MTPNKTSLDDTAVVYILTKLELGGAQKVCLSLLEGLEKEGKTTYLITGSSGTLVDQVKQKQNIIFIEHFKREIKNPLSEIKGFVAIVGTLKKLKKQHKNVIVHTHSTKAGLFGRWAAFFARIKTRMHTVHGFGFHEYQNKLYWTINYILELVTSFITTHYICVSEKDRSTGKKFFFQFNKKSHIIRAAIDNEKFVAARKLKQNSQDKFVFGTVACFKPQKNLFDLLTAFKIVNQHNPNTYLEIIGDGILRSKIELWIKENHLTNKIKLLGWQDNVAQIMAEWNAFALSSLWEGLPCSVIEARILGLPVIAYDVGGISEIIKNGQNGRLVKPKDVRGLASAMEIEIKNDNKNNSENLEQFYKQTMVSKHLDLYFAKYIYCTLNK